MGEVLCECLVSWKWAVFHALEWLFFIAVGAVGYLVYRRWREHRAMRRALRGAGR